jgi:hypothetical protein
VIFKPLFYETALEKKIFEAEDAIWCDNRTHVLAFDII